MAGAGVAATVLALVAACGTGFGSVPADQPSVGSADIGTGPLSVLIGSSGDAETQAVTQAVAAWSGETGVRATVTPAANLAQQLSQGFAASRPPDVFYVSTDFFASYASNGSLYPYGKYLKDVDDFYPTLRDSFTFDGELYCAPKDFSTLALVINDAAWAKAGLTAADYPTTWDELAAVAKKLTTGDQTGLVFTPEWQRLGVFMAQAGGGLLDADGHAALDSPQNLQALQYVKSLLASGDAKFASEVSAGWGGEAFGTGRAAMTIEGNWIVGALAADYPDVRYTVVPLPKGPAGPGTLQFTNCWGVPTDSAHRAAAVNLVEHLTAGDQQMAFARAIGVMPSISSVSDRWSAEFPEQSAFLQGASYAQGVPPLVGVSDVIADLNSQLQGLRTADPEQILRSVQIEMEAVAG